MKQCIVSICVYLCGTFVSLAADFSLTFTPHPARVTLGSNVLLNTIQFSSRNTSGARADLVWIFDYLPAPVFQTITDTNGEGPGYCFCGRRQDFNLFTNWRLVDDRGIIVGHGSVILPHYPETMMARLVFTNVSLSLGTNKNLSLSLFATMAYDLEKDISRGIVSGDEVRTSLLMSDLKIWEGEERLSFEMVNNQPALDYTIIERKHYSAIDLITEVGDELLLTARVEPGKLFRLEVAEKIDSQDKFKKVYSGSETVLGNEYGEIFFLVPKFSDRNRYFRVRSVEDADIDSFDLVHIGIILLENGSNSETVRAGQVLIRPEIRTTERVRPIEYNLLSDIGETGHQENFAPTFAAGVHWVRLYVRGAATDALAFKWIIVRP